MALIGAGLGIREFREYACNPFGCYPYLEESEPGMWKVRDARQDLPLVFRVHATKDR